MATDLIRNRLIAEQQAERTVTIRTRSGATHVGFVDDVTDDAIALTNDKEREVKIALDAIESVEGAPL